MAKKEAVLAAARLGGLGGGHGRSGDADDGSTVGWEAVAAARVARSRPNFLQKWCKATVETWTPQVRLEEVEHVVVGGVGCVGTNSAVVTSAWR